MLVVHDEQITALDGVLLKPAREQRAADRQRAEREREARREEAIDLVLTATMAGATGEALRQILDAAYRKIDASAEANKETE